MQFLDILEIFNLEIGQSRSDLLKNAFVPNSMPFFRLAPRFTTFLFRYLQKSKFQLRYFLDKKVADSFWTGRWPTTLGLFFSLCLSFSSFLIFLVPGLTFYCVCFHLKKFRESIINTSKFYHGVAMCSHRQFCSVFFCQISGHVTCIFQAPPSWSPWSEYRWKDLFHLQKLSTEDANFGQRWWSQK